MLVGFFPECWLCLKFCRIRDGFFYLHWNLLKIERGKGLNHRKSVSLDQIAVPEHVGILVTFSGHFGDVLDLSWSKSLPTDLYGKFTWKIENFSTITKRELRSNAFEVGGYKWFLGVALGVKIGGQAASPAPAPAAKVCDFGLSRLKANRTLSSKSAAGTVLC
ncbi:Serine/threonine-protein kinase CTR1 [Acorus gramineus]|uniref:Serine/threonine-protein kinase CTR1 n=1 Tax=Acorus gramineus TaxID=55184 RepID=A0AAV9B768_ACOGR|nr:Serine/threonine-protein kinase CTR1 [Acorus gramineus]